MGDQPGTPSTCSLPMATLGVCSPHSSVAAPAVAQAATLEGTSSKLWCGHVILSLQACKLQELWGHGYCKSVAASTRGRQKLVLRQKHYRAPSLGQWLGESWEWGHPQKPQNYSASSVQRQPVRTVGTRFQPVRPAWAKPSKVMGAGLPEVLGAQLLPQCIQKVGHGVEGDYSPALRLNVFSHCAQPWWVISSRVVEML